MGVTASENELFPKLTEEQISCLQPHGEEVLLAEGDAAFQEGDPEAEFFIVLEGGLRVTREVAGSDVQLAMHEPGEFTGALSMLTGDISIATGRAIGPTRLLRISEQKFETLFVHCPPVARFLLAAMAQRRPEADALTQQRLKLEALGKLSAGLAHELNNPSAAVARAASQLKEVFERLQPVALRLGQSCLQADLAAFLRQLEQEVIVRAAGVEPLDTLTQSDREDAVTEWLDKHAVPDGWKMAPALVSAGLDTPDLERLAEKAPPEALPDVLEWLEVTLAAASLIQGIEESAGRITDLMKAVKSYTYRDEAPEQEVDLHQGIESTLIMLGHRLRSGNIQIVRAFDRSLPPVPVFGSELNQVWTNLIDNAIDALEEAREKDGGKERRRITLRTSREADFALIEVEDNGPGIPEDIVPRIFEPFFTTKEVGQGSGLGLEIAHRIITVRHKGDIRVDTEPGRTCFQVRLPLKPSA